MKKNLKTWIWIDRKTDIGKSEPDNQFPFFEETMNLENSHILQLKQQKTGLPDQKKK